MADLTKHLRSADSDPLALAQMIQWYAPRTWQEIERYWREKIAKEAGHG